jgi:hypothetical protein
MAGQALACRWATSEYSADTAAHGPSSDCRHRRRSAARRSLTPEMAKRDAAVTVATPTPASALVWRPALVDRLENAATGPVTVVSAPAGSGKTVLVRSWLESRGAAAHAAWVSVERGERDAQRFWDQLFAKVRAATSAGARPP